MFLQVKQPFNSTYRISNLRKCSLRFKNIILEDLFIIESYINDWWNLVISSTSSGNIYCILCMDQILKMYKRSDP